LPFEISRLKIVPYALLHFSYLCRAPWGATRLLALVRFGTPVGTLAIFGHLASLSLFLHVLCSSYSPRPWTRFPSFLFDMEPPFPSLSRLKALAFFRSAFFDSRPLTPQSDDRDHE